ncbi:MAG: beta-ketoacyl synthase chain length factor [Pseudomonadota bacterium]|jgi:hypothetical protein
MVTDLKASILGWSCFPGLERFHALDSAEAKTFSAEGLDVDFIPSSLRRRCSTLTKVTLAVAHATVRGKSLQSIPTVFSSAHGESEITAALLRDLAIDQQLSPMGFSLSVHNAASGLFSIATGNTAASTAIAAGERSFIMGLCEALLMSADNPEVPVLYVCSDDRVPSVFLREGDETDRPFAIALLISASEMSEGCAMQVVVGGQARADDEFSTALSSAWSVKSFIRWLNDETSSVQLSDDGSVWCCEASTPRAPLFRSPFRQ